MRIDLIDLELVVHVHELGTITAAAAQAGLSTAAASARLRAVEALLGVALFERGARRAVPTAAGDALLARARQVLGQLGALEHDLRGHRAGAHGRVAMAGNTAGCRELMPGVLADFLPAHPQVEVALDERRSEAVLDAVAAGEVELGLVSDAVPADGLQSVVLRPDPLAVVLSAGDRLAGRDGLSLAELEGEALVGLTPECALQSLVESQARRGGARLRHRTRVAGLDAVCALAARGVGTGLVPATAARRAAGQPGLRVVPLAEPWARRRLLLVARSFDELSPAARRLAGRVQAHVAAEA